MSDEKKPEDVPKEDALARAFREAREFIDALENKVRPPDAEMVLKLLIADLTGLVKNQNGCYRFEIPRRNERWIREHSGPLVLSTGIKDSRDKVYLSFSLYKGEEATETE